MVISKIYFWHATLSVNKGKVYFAMGVYQSKQPQSIQHPNIDGQQTVGNHNLLLYL